MSIKLTSNSKFKNDGLTTEFKMKQLAKTTLSRTLNYLAYNNTIVSTQHKYLLITVSL